MEQANAFRTSAESLCWRSSSSLFLTLPVPRSAQVNISRSLAQLFRPRPRFSQPKLKDLHCTLLSIHQPLSATSHKLHIACIPSFTTFTSARISGRHSESRARLFGYYQIFNPISVALVDFGIQTFLSLQFASSLCRTVRRKVGFFSKKLHCHNFFFFFFFSLLKPLPRCRVAAVILCPARQKKLPGI